MEIRLRNDSHKKIGGVTISMAKLSAVADLPSNVWCVTNKKQHMTVRAPIIEKHSTSQSYIMSFAQKHQAEMFRVAICSRMEMEQTWPYLVLNSDYSLEIPGPFLRGRMTRDMGIENVKLAKLIERGNLNGVSIGLIYDFVANDSKYRFRGSKITQSALPKIEDYRAHLNKILRY